MVGGAGVIPSAAPVGERTVSKLAEPLLQQANDINAARGALSDAANMARGLWISFISVSAYLAVAVGAVTHRNLFLQDPLKLPLLGVELPIVAFFWISPLLFLVLHAYLLLHLKFTGDSVREYERSIKNVLNSLPEDERADIEDRLRMQLPNFPMVQMLVPPAVNRTGIVRWALAGIILATVIVGPVFLLGLIQLQFLPYHSEPVTWVHRLSIVADLTLICLFWPLIIGKSIGQWHIFTRCSVYFLIFIILFMSIIVSAFPGERMYKSSGLGIRSMANFLFEGGVNEVSGRQNSWFSNRLVLIDQDFSDVDDEELLSVNFSRSFVGRHLERAVFTRADLRKADFTSAHLEGAIFDSANVKNATFSCRDTGEVPNNSKIGENKDKNKVCRETAMQEVSFYRAQLQGSYMNRAKLSKAYMVRAQLQGVLLAGADLRDANLFRAQMQGGLMDDVQLGGAYIERAEFQGASLRRVNFAGLSLDRTQLQGAILEETSFVDVKMFKLDYVYLASRSQEDATDNYSIDRHINYLIELSCNNSFAFDGKLSSIKLGRSGDFGDAVNNSAREANPAPFVAENILGVQGVLSNVATTPAERAYAAETILKRIESGECQDASGMSDQKKRQLRGWAPDWKPLSPKA